MQALKIELEGVTTSFRYPHLMVGRQPSYPLPPPATIYGHIASALGEYPAASEFRFAYAFTHQGSVDDYEHTWLVQQNDEGIKMNPTVRQMLFRPRLTLYLDRPEWYEHFRNPVYPVLLGRSQDLASYNKVEVVKLEQRSAGYFDNTLLEFEPWRPRVGLGQGLLMPRYIQPDDRQRVKWARYVALEHRVFLPFKHELSADAKANSDTSELTGPLFVRGVPTDYAVWVDPSSPEHKDRQRALEWLSVDPQIGEALELSA